MAGKEVTLEEEANSEVLIADIRIGIKRMFSGSRVAITNTSQRNHPPNCPIVCFLLHPNCEYCVS